MAGVLKALPGSILALLSAHLDLFDLLKLALFSGDKTLSYLLRQAGGVTTLNVRSKPSNRVLTFAVALQPASLPLFLALTCLSLDASLIDSPPTTGLSEWISSLPSTLRELRIRALSLFDFLMRPVHDLFDPPLVQYVCCKAGKTPPYSMPSFRSSNCCI